MNTRIAIVCALLSFGALSQIKELRSGQDVRKNYIDPQKKTDYFSKTPYVDPFIGTGGHGHTYPGASAPFGMIQLSPDTRYDGWDGCSGYHYSDSVIYGFSHTHLSGTGVPDYGDLLIIPQNGNPKVDPGYSHKKGYGSRFNHNNEEASPGFYRVHLIDGNIDVRLTVGQRSGIHEYTFNNPKGEKFILLDLDHRDQLLDSEINVLDKNHVSGKRISKAWANEQHFYFHLEIDKPYTKARVISDGGRHKLLLVYPKQTTTIKVKIGISSVDIAGAKKNLEQEIPDWDFDRLRAETTRSWNRELDKISFSSPDQATMKIFYTALYHSFLSPNIFSDSDGRYRGRDQKIHQLNQKEGDQYTVFSLWDTYRATHPLFTLVQEGRTLDFVKTFLRQYEQGRDLPVWELAANETECMIGYHSVSVISDAYAKGLVQFDAEKALEAMLATSNFDEFGKHDFRDKGFISMGSEPESVSRTLEYAYDDFCIAQFANRLGNDNVYKTYLKRSLNFLNVFDPQTGFMRARKDALWQSPFDPFEVNFNFTEANSWQYSLYTPHAVDILSKALGSSDSLETWLDRLFTVSTNLTGRDQADITGLIGQYAHGNEPSHHMAYLYNYTREQHKTQAYVDQILREMYSDKPDGLSGNEDCGQMSSWYVLSALGLYQIAPGHPVYDFGRPLLHKAEIQLENGKSIVFKTINNTKQNKYIQKIWWNGNPWNSLSIAHDTLMSGGELIFEMGSSPNSVQFPRNTSALNESALQETGFVPVPFIANESIIFTDSMYVTLGVVDLNEGKSSILYQLNELPLSSYEEPILIRDHAKIDLVTVSMDETGRTNTSHGIKTRLIKRDNSIHIDLKTAYANQYAGSGPTTLIDGIRGSNEYRTGDWQGYWGKDVIAEVRFDQGRSIAAIGAGCLRDHKSWIFYPSEIVIETSTDGINFAAGIKLKIPPAKDGENPEITDHLLYLPESQLLKAVRFTLKNPGVCPAWHLGSGNDTWIFIDEFIMK